MHRRPPQLEFIDERGNVAANVGEIAAFLYYEHIGRLRWEWELRAVHIRVLPGGRIVPSVSNLIAMGTGITKTNALCRAQTVLTQYLNHQGEIA